jgi:hypothetical protein
VERVLARGGMAVVYLARQPALDRWVALKRLDLTSGEPSLAQRFVDEARVVARLDHPNIVTVHDLLEHEGTPYIAMEYVSGGSLRPLIGRLDLCQVIGVLDDVLAGLAHAARQGVTHRDLKPENVLVTPHGSCKIADFGIALAHDAVTRLTSTGTAMGTPVYMAPEQAQGRAVDPRTDLYALGVMAYELLAGRPPFPADEAPLAVLYRHVHDPVPPLEPVVQGTPESLVDWVLRLLAKDPDERPPGAAVARRALEELAVARLGAYWRRDAALAGPGPDGAPAAPEAATGPAAATQDGPEPSRQPATAVARAATSPTRRVRPRRRGLVRYGAVAGAVLAAAAGVALGARGGDGAPDADTPARATTAQPFALGGGRAVAAGLPQARPDGAPRGSGAVVLLAGDRARLLTPRRPERRAAFGTAVASADFDRDGRADLAVGSPGARAGAASGTRGAVDVFPAGADGEAARFTGPDDRLEGRGAGFGTALAAGDLDGDGYGDLLAGAPDSDPFPKEDRGSGTIRVLFGGPGGLTERRSRILRRPRPGDRDFGSLLAVADVDDDGHLDVLEAGPGHGAYCAGGPDGPQECRRMAGSGATALAAGDLTGDGLAEVVHGHPAEDPESPGGHVLVYRGRPGGPARRPLRIDQDTPHISGHRQPLDRFGAAIAVADVDRDDFADLLVGAPGEDDGAGRFSLIRGGAAGYATTGNRSFEQGNAGMPGAKRPGNAFGAAVAVRPRGDGALDLVVAAPGSGAAGTAWVLEDVDPALAAHGIRPVSLARVAGPGGRRLSLTG